MRKRVLQILCLLGLIGLLGAAPAEAKDMKGRFGLGLDNNLTASTLGIGKVPASSNSMNAPSLGLSLKYWINNDWAVVGVFGFIYATGAATKENQDGLKYDKSGIWGFALDLKGIYNFAKSDTANMGLFATFHMRKENATNQRPSGPYHSNLGLALALGFTPEVFIVDSFALTGEFGLTFRVQNGFGMGISGDNLLGGLGFHYYF